MSMVRAIYCIHVCTCVCMYILYIYILFIHENLDHGNKDKKTSNRYKSNSEGKEASGEELKDKPNSLNPEPKYETDYSKDGNEIDGIKSSSKIEKEVVQSGVRNKNGNESLNEVDGSNSSDGKP